MKRLTLSVTIIDLRIETFSSVGESPSTPEGERVSDPVRNLSRLPSLPSPAWIESFDGRID